MTDYIDEEMFDLWVGAQDEQRYVKIHWAYLEAFGGYYEACAFLHEVARLQVSEGGKRNGGWVVWTNAQLAKNFFITRYMKDKIVALLAPFGLITKQDTHALYPNSIVNYYRIDKRVFMEKMKPYLNAKKPSSDMNSEHPNENIYGGDANFSMAGDANFSTIKEVMSLENVVRDMQPTPNGVGAGLSKDSNSKKKVTPNTPPNQTGANLSPAPRPNNLHDSSHPHTPTPYETVYREVRRKFFAIADDLPADDRVTGQIKKIAGYLWNESIRPANESLEDKGAGLVADISRFMAWYAKKTSGAFLPRSPEKLGTYWLEYMSHRIAPPPTASYVMQEWGGAVKTDTTNSPANGEGGDTMELDNNIFGFLFGKRKDNDNE